MYVWTLHFGVNQMFLAKKKTKWWKTPSFKHQADIEELETTYTNC